MRDPRHILITGASSGLGAALALDYAAQGMHLFLQGRDESRLNHVAAQARAQGAAVSTHIGDVTDKAAMAAWITAADAAAELHLVIANAGISGGTAKGVEGPGQTQAIFAANIDGVVNTLTPIMPAMIKRRRGQMAIVSSLAGFIGMAGAPAYCASKAAVRVWGEGLRADMAAHGVEVNVICPGFVKTPMTDVNPYPMPFLMPVARAAQMIRTGLEKNRGRIAFPWQMYLLVRLLMLLPRPLLEKISYRMPRKS